VCVCKCPRMLENETLPSPAYDDSRRGRAGSVRRLLLFFYIRNRFVALTGVCQLERNCRHTYDKRALNATVKQNETNKVNSSAE
jgi:hypothetical protein